MRATGVIAAALMGLAAGMAHSEDGRGLAAGCAACHGTNGYALGGNAPLAGMPRQRLASAMHAFKSGERSGTVMPQIARGYTDAEIEALAAWFAAQRPAP